jgi:hypothetical protein
MNVFGDLENKVSSLPKAAKKTVAKRVVKKASDKEVVE